MIGVLAHGGGDVGGGFDLWLLGFLVTPLLVGVGVIAVFRLASRGWADDGDARDPGRRVPAGSEGRWPV